VVNVFSTISLRDLVHGGRMPHAAAATLLSSPSSSSFFCDWPGRREGEKLFVIVNVPNSQYWLSAAMCTLNAMLVFADTD